jgi:hypothetical protein
MESISTTNKSFLFVLILGFIFTLTSCEDKVEVTRKYTIYEPVYMAISELRESVDIIEPQPISVTGKLYLYQNMVLINDPGKGIHLVDNSDQASPITIGYINIPGNYDFSVRGDILYADSYMDLVLLDISDLGNIHEINRVTDIFQDFNFESGMYIHPDSGLVVDYVEKEVIEVTSGEFQGQYFPDYYYLSSSRGVSFDMASSEVAFMAAPTGTPVGIGGSMATFTIVNSHLYILDNSNMLTFDISNPDNPANVDILPLGWGIETIFPYKENIFVGSQNGMYIINNTEQDNPELISMYSHITSCDPVVVQDNYAYVTLRAGWDCRSGSLNQLEVIDISNLNSPQLLKVYPMLEPFGLGIDGNALFVCEGTHGLKVFDATDKNKISDNQLLHLNNIDAFDVIPYNNTLYLIGQDGLYQFDYTDINDITMISKLEVTNTTNQ